MLFHTARCSAPLRQYAPSPFKRQLAQLYVDNKPFIIAGGELRNSSGSSLQELSPIWPKLRRMNLNTVVAPVYWELLEPAEAKFDFTLVDGLIDGSRKNSLKLVLLWFGNRFELVFIQLGT